MRLTEAKQLIYIVIREIIKDSYAVNSSQFLPLPKFFFIKLKARKVFSLHPSSSEFMLMTKAYQSDLPTCQFRKD